MSRSFPGTKLITIEPTEKTTRKQLVKEALGSLKCAPDGAIFWVVYDREGPTKYPDALHAEARQNARGGSMSPCPLFVLKYGY